MAQFHTAPEVTMAVWALGFGSSEATLNTQLVTAIVWHADMSQRYLLRVCVTLQDGFRWLESTYRDKARGWVGFNVALSHRITAAADIVLMPSRFEPCGLNQVCACVRVCWCVQPGVCIVQHLLHQHQKTNQPACLKSEHKPARELV